MKTTNNKPQNGFTLIEIMIVVAIIGILSAIAYPSYTEQVRKGKRAKLAGMMLECAAIQERRYTLNNTYNNTACAGFNNPVSDYIIAVTTPRPGTALAANNLSLIHI